MPPLSFLENPSYTPLVTGLTQKRSVLILVLSSLAVYIQTLGFPWIHLDDYKHIFENPLILNPSFNNLWEFWKAPFFTLYIPFTYTVWFIVALFSQSAWIFHLTNVVLHIGSAVLVYFILKEIFKEEFPSLAGALLFAVHPVQVEAVTWISGLKDCLSGFFVFLALYLYTIRIGKKKNIPVGSIYLVTTLALLSKPASVIIPALFLIFRRLLVRETWKTSFKQITGFLLLIVPIAIITKEVQPDFQVKDLAPLWFRPIVSLHALGFYLKQVLIPFQYVLDYGKNPRWLMKNGFEDAYLLAFILGFCLLYFQKRKNLIIQMAFFLFLIPLLPTLGMIPFQFQLFSTVADRYIYLSMFGIAFGFAYFVRTLPKFITEIQCAVFLFLLGLFTISHVNHWRTNEAIFAYTISVNPQSFLARNNLSYELYEKQRFKEAADQLKIVTQLRPEEPELFLNYSAALAKSGQTHEAAVVLKEVLRKNPDLQQAQRLLEQLGPNG